MTLHTHTRLGDPFNPAEASAPFSAGVRINESAPADPAKDEELRASMQQIGWIPALPAVKDERGVFIIGSRRMRIAAELNITPCVVEHRFGNGDAADIKRLQWAWFSNEGAQSFSPDDRRAMAAYLASRGWTQASIADALGVAQQTVSRDLGSLITHPGNKDSEAAAAAAGKRQRGSGAGRPRGATTRPRPEPQAKPDPLPDLPPARPRPRVTEPDVPEISRRRPETIEAEHRVEAHLRENPKLSNNQILALAGLGQPQHRLVKRVRDRMVAAGEIPNVTERTSANGRVVRTPPPALSLVTGPDDSHAPGCTHCPVHCPAA